MSRIYNIASIIATGLALALSLSFAGHHAWGWDWLGLVAVPPTALWVRAERKNVQEGD